MNLHGNRVFVKDGNIDKALRKLKKKVAESGLLLELQKRETYIKPSVRRKVARAMAKKRWKKQVAQQNMFTHKK